jgi:hypothetical protein
MTNLVMRRSIREAGKPMDTDGFSIPVTLTIPSFGLVGRTRQVLSPIDFIDRRDIETYSEDRSTQSGAKAVDGTEPQVVRLPNRARLSY